MGLRKTSAALSSNRLLNRTLVGSTMDRQEHCRQKIREIQQRLDKWKLSLQTDIEDIKQELTAIMPNAKVAPKSKVQTRQETSTSLVPQTYYFTIRTEKGQSSGTELQYREKYAKPPTSWGPRVWIDRIAGHYSLLVGRKRRPVPLTGQKLELLCLHLEKFNQLVGKNELVDKFTNYPQVLHQLHNVTFDVLRPFIDVQPGQGQRLMPHSKDNRRLKLTFYLITRYKTSCEQSEESHG